MSEHFESIKKGLEEAIAYEKQRIEQNTHKKQAPEKDKTESSTKAHSS